MTASCEPCGCNPSGSTTLVCDKDLGTCSCIPNVVNLLCDTPAGGYYVKALDNVKFEAEMANFVNVSCSSMQHIQYIMYCVHIE